MASWRKILYFKVKLPILLKNFNAIFKLILTPFKFKNKKLNIPFHWQAAALSLVVDRVRVDVAAQPKVADFRVVLVMYENVPRRDVPVDEALLAEVLQTVANLHRKL